MNRLDHIQFVRHDLKSLGRRHYVNEDDVKVVLSRMPEELWDRLRKVHFKDDSRGARRSGYTTVRGRREITLCALPYQTSFPRGLAEEFGAVRGSQWPAMAVRRRTLYDTFLHELGHLQIARPSSKNPHRKFASETLAQSFADHWRRKLWSVPVDHPDPVHNRPSEEELAAVKTGWLQANLAYRKGASLISNGKRREAVPHLRRAVALYPYHAQALEGLADAALFGLGERRRELRFEEARDFAQRALLADPGLQEAAAILAESLSHLRQKEAARRAYQRAIELDTCGKMVEVMYANALSNWGEAAAAEKLYARLRRRPACRFLALNYHAIHLLKWKNDPAATRKAVEFLRRAAREDPRDGMTRYRLALAYEKLGGHLEDAIREARESLRLEPTLKLAAALLARLTAGTQKS